MLQSVSGFSQQQSVVATDSYNLPPGGAGENVPPGGAILAGGSGLSDLLGLESELSNIQAGIQQIDRIAPNTSNLSFPTDSMIPIMSTQQQSNSNVYGYLPPQANQPQPQQQQSNQSQNVGEVKSFPQAIVNTGQISQQRADAFGATPFLPPPPKTSRQRSQEGSAQLQEMTQQQAFFPVNQQAGFVDPFAKANHQHFPQACQQQATFNERAAAINHPPGIN